MKGVETSNSLETVAHQLRGAEIDFVCRYYDGYGHAKQLSSAELAALEEGGVKIVSAYERGYPTSVGYFTEDRGEFDGRKAVEVATQLGQPEDTPIYFAVDFDAYKDSDRDAVLAYFRGVDEGMQQAWDAAKQAGHEPRSYAVGAYGGAYVINWLDDAGLASYFWQAHAPGWSGGTNKTLHPLANLHTVGIGGKVAGVDVDPVDAITDDYGGWSRVLT